MLLDCKDIIIKHYALGMSGREIAEELSVSKSGVNKFLAAFKACKTLNYPLPAGITNYGISAAVYEKNPGVVGRDLSYEMPDYETVVTPSTTWQHSVLYARSIMVEIDIGPYFL